MQLSSHPERVYRISLSSGTGRYYGTLMVGAQYADSPRSNWFLLILLRFIKSENIEYIQNIIED